MSMINSKDGTRIAYEKKGSGPAVILVDGAICYRSFGPMQQLSELLVLYFTVYTYDRRGRGESSNSKPFAVDCEIEDLEALIDAAGGKAYVYGISSGACLALEAALKLGKKITKLALYEPPYNSDPADKLAWKQYREQLGEALAESCRGDAVALFMQFVGTTAERLNGMRQAPVWPMFKAVAPTLIYDAAAMGDDRVRLLSNGQQKSLSRHSLWMVVPIFSFYRLCTGLQLRLPRQSPMPSSVCWKVKRMT